MDSWEIMSVAMVMFIEIMNTDLVPEIVVQITQRLNYKKIVKMVVQMENAVQKMLAILVTVEMFIGIIHVI